MDFFAELALAAVAVLPLILQPTSISSRQSDTAQQRQYPHDASDPITQAFNEAATFMLNTKGIRLDTDTKLAFYGLYKVSTQGSCTLPAPSRLDMVAWAKWDSWRQASVMSSMEAKQRYLELASIKIPQWRLNSRTAPMSSVEHAAALAAADAASVLRSQSKQRKPKPAKTTTDDNDGLGDLADDSDDDEGEGSGKASADNEKGFGASVSRMTMPEEHVVRPEDRGLLYYIQEGDVSKVEELLKQSSSLAVINTCDAEQGMAPLHWASDRNNIDIAAKLLDAGAQIDVKDAEGITPLQYAVTCGHEAMVRFLLSRGSDPTLVDGDEISCASATIQGLFTEADAALPPTVVHTAFDHARMKPISHEAPSIIVATSPTSSSTARQANPATEGLQRRQSDGSWASFSIPTSPPVEMEGDMLIVGHEQQGNNKTHLDRRIAEEEIDQDLLRFTLKPRSKQQQQPPPSQ